MVGIEGLVWGLDEGDYLGLRLMVQFGVGRLDTGVGLVNVEYPHLPNPLDRWS